MNHLIYGANDYFFDFAGYSVGQAEAAATPILNLHPMAVPYQAGKPTTIAEQIVFGARIEWMKESGLKEAQPWYLKEEVMEQLSQTESEFQTMVDQGAKVFPVDGDLLMRHSELMKWNSKLKGRLYWPIQVRLDTNEVCLHGKTYVFEKKRVVILHLLAEAKGVPLSRAKMTKHPELEFETHLEREINSLKEESRPFNKCIKSERGKGYWLEF